MLTLNFILVACGTSATTVTQEATPKAVDNSSAQRIKLIINNQDEVFVKLNNTAPVKDFLTMLPLELTFSDFNNTEKISNLPRKLNPDGAPNKITAMTGSFCYYIPWGNLAIFYRDHGQASNLIELGTIESGIEKLGNQRSNFNMKIEIVK